MNIGFHQHVFVGAAGRTAVSSLVLPVTSGLQLQLESSDFDGLADGAQITGWNDLSGNGRNASVVGGATNNPFISQTVQANGHATVKWAQGSGHTPQMQITKFGVGSFTSAELFCVIRRISNTSTGTTDEGTPFTFNLGNNSGSDFPSLLPFTDTNIYEGFGNASRPSTGHPTTDLSTAFFVYNVQASTQLVVLVNNEQRYNSASTFNWTCSNSVFYLGQSISNVQSFVASFGGYAAAYYLYNRVLSSSERTQVRTYCNTKWGTPS